MSISITLAKSPSDMVDVARFWYEIYCVLRGVLRDQADHELRELRDPLMTAGGLLVARNEGTIVGTIMTTNARDVDLGEYRDFYELGDLEDFPEAVAITTKFMVAPEYRAGTLPIRLLQTGVRKSLSEGIARSFFDCNPPLDVMFEAMGMRDHIGLKRHPDFGLVRVMQLRLTGMDAESIRTARRNPLASCFDRKLNQLEQTA